LVTTTATTIHSNHTDEMLVVHSDSLCTRWPERKHKIH